MTPKKLKIRQEDKSAAKDYLKKAGDNLKAMQGAIETGNFNAAGTLALQCAISSADAICVHEKGVRSISQDHFDVCDLVSSITLPDAKEKANVLKRIIGKKNLIQYERRNIFQSEAVDVVKAATRFYEWVEANIQ
jgi:HEPN domain-containing protein